MALSADRKFFREMTKGTMVIVGRKTLADFPGGKPLPNRVNVVMTRSPDPMEGVVTCHSPQEAAQLAATADKAMVIGGGSVYKQLLPYCTRAYVTRVGACPKSDTFFPNLDESPDWQLTRVLQEGQENGISYQMCLYQRKA